MNMSKNLSLAPGVCSKYLEQCQLSEGGGIVLFCGLLESGIRVTQLQMMLVGGMVNFSEFWIVLSLAAVRTCRFARSFETKELICCFGILEFVNGCLGCCLCYVAPKSDDVIGIQNSLIVKF